MLANRGSFLIASYTNSGVKGSPNCSNSSLFSRIRSFSAETVESITRYSRMNMILSPWLVM